MKDVNVMGVMSGSSLDGIDIAICNFGNSKMEIIHTASVEIPSSLKEKLANGIKVEALELLETQNELTKILAGAINDISDEKIFDFHAVASHGHTIYHDPEKQISLQIINGGVLASLVGKDVIADFRVQDVAANGKGTPLVPIVERDVFGEYDYYLNLGGIANITKVRDGNWEAYDLCPANQILNFLAGQLGKEYDEDGSLAAEGVVVPELFREWKKEAYFSQAGPKSLDNNWIKDYWRNKVFKPNYKIKDLLRTYSEFIVEICLENVVNLGKKQTLFVTGGGTHNAFITQRLKERLSSKKVELHVPSKQIIDFKEAILMAYMGYLRINNQVNIISSVTGAESEFSAGAIYLAAKS